MHDDSEEVGDWLGYYLPHAHSIYLQKAFDIIEIQKGLAILVETQIY